MPFKQHSYTGGTIHHFAPDLTAYEHSPSSPSASSTTTSTNTVIWITGLFGTLFSTPYVSTLSVSLPSNWLLVEPSLSTARLGFGVGSLDTDVTELSLLVGYIQSLRPHGKIVLAGHSTGCQDALHYVTAALTEKERKRTVFPPVPSSNGRRPRVDAIVLQAPVSDRIAMSVTPVPEAITSEAQATAEQFVRDKRGRDVLPRRLTAALGYAPVSANRWLSLTSPGPEHAGLDDMFSHDLRDDRLVKTFGSVDRGVRILAVLSGKDEYVPDSVDQGALCERWKDVTRKGEGIWDDESGVLQGAIHDLTQDDQDVTKEFCRRVVAFLGRVEVQGDSKM